MIEDKNIELTIIVDKETLSNAISETVKEHLGKREAKQEPCEHCNENAKPLYDDVIPGTADVVRVHVVGKAMVIENDRRVRFRFPIERCPACGREL